MAIIKIEEPLSTGIFGDLIEGDVFKVNSKVCIKLQSSEHKNNTFNLELNDTMSLNYNDKITKVSSAILTIED